MTRTLSAISLGIAQLALVTACVFPSPETPRPPAARPDPVQAERDAILSLLAYAVVLDDWQSGEEPRRGYNIGAVLVDPGGEIVGWARNSNHATQNGTQHAEVRLMQHRLEDVPSYHLRDFTVVTTLEPCAQCAGMMILQRVRRVVYGQSDPGFGSALQRLALDTSELPRKLPAQYAEGYPPYPRSVEPVASPHALRVRMEQSHDESGLGITDWLETAEALALYQEAAALLASMDLTYEENRGTLDDARAFLAHEVKDASADIGTVPSGGGRH